MTFRRPTLLAAIALAVPMLLSAPAKGQFGGAAGFADAFRPEFLERDMPLLGICGGQQLLHVALGGTLIQHIPDEIENPLPHEQPNPRDEAGHDTEVVKNTLLHRIASNTNLSVNSAHHQAVKDVGENVVVNAVAPDGVIEGIESADYAFCLGVQWHPEFSIDPADAKIFKAFTDAAAEYR